MECLDEGLVLSSLIGWAALEVKAIYWTVIIKGLKPIIIATMVKMLEWSAYQVKL